MISDPVSSLSSVQQSNPSDDLASIVRQSSLRDDMSEDCDDSSPGF